jgi:hypothetical protein
MAGVREIENVDDEGDAYCGATGDKRISCIGIVCGGKGCAVSSAAGACGATAPEVCGAADTGGALGDARITGAGAAGAIIAPVSCVDPCANAANVAKALTTATMTNNGHARCDLLA